MKQTLLEKTLEKSFNDHLDLLEIFHVKGQAQGKRGYPDKKVYHDRIYHVELKVGKEHGSYYKQLPMQKWWQRRIEKSNGIYILLEGQMQVDGFIEYLKSKGDFR
jgi:hypothetical protein